MNHSSALREVSHMRRPTFLETTTTNTERPRMIKNTLSLLLALVCFTLIGCGSTDLRSLVERVDAAEARATAAERRAEEAEARADEVRDAALAGETPDTSGGDAGEVAEAPVAPIGSPIMSAVPVGSTGGTSGVLQMCDGVDGAGMLTSGMLTSTMAFSTGSEPWGAYTMDGMDYLIQNNSIFDVAIAIDG